MPFVKKLCLVVLIVCSASASQKGSVIKLNKENFSNTIVSGKVPCSGKVNKGYIDYSKETKYSIFYTGNSKQGVNIDFLFSPKFNLRMVYKQGEDTFGFLKDFVDATISVHRSGNAGRSPFLRGPVALYNESLDSDGCHFISNLGAPVKLVATSIYVDNRLLNGKKKHSDYEFLTQIFKNTIDGATLFIEDKKPVFDDKRLNFVFNKWKVGINDLLNIIMPNVTKDGLLSLSESFLEFQSKIGISKEFAPISKGLESLMSHDMRSLLYALCIATSGQHDDPFIHVDLFNVAKFIEHVAKRGHFLTNESLYLGVENSSYFLLKDGYSEWEFFKLFWECLIKSMIWDEFSKKLGDDEELKPKRYIVFDDVRLSEQFDSTLVIEGHFDNFPMLENMFYVSNGAAIETNSFKMILRKNNRIFNKKKIGEDYEIVSLYPVKASNYSKTIVPFDEKDFKNQVILIYDIYAILDNLEVLKMKMNSGLDLLSPFIFWYEDF